MLSTFGASSGPPSPAAALVRLSQVAARPNFEVRFAATQEAMLTRLNREIEAFQQGDNSEAKTALLRLKVTRLERNLATTKDYAEVVSRNKANVGYALDRLTELRALADPATVADFEAKRSEILETLDKLRTAVSFTLGVPDGLREARVDAHADLAGIVHNDFATADDVAAAQAVIDDVFSRLTASLEIIDVNRDMASKLAGGLERSLDQANLEIDDIEFAARKGQLDRVRELQDRTARQLSSLSLAFEASQFLSSFVAENTVLPKRPDPGSVLNLFA